MKKIKYLTMVFLATIIFYSCNEDKWLKEVPFDFYSPENSYVTAAQFNSAVATLYGNVNSYMLWNPDINIEYHYGSDIAYCPLGPTINLNSYSDALIPEYSNALFYWKNNFRTIFDANVIIGRIDGKETEFKSETERNILKAEAMFFRAFAYRNLGIMFGGVPIVLKEISEPRRDFVRASPDQVWSQCINDLKFAVANLPGVTELKEEGRLTKAAANHLLAELYIIKKDYDKSIASASVIIDDPNYALMTDRFGTRKDKPGDVYNDLFVRGNQNRNHGINTESIWVAQYEYKVEGGGSGSKLCRYLIPNYWSITGNTDRKNLFIGPTSKYGGRGIGVITPSDYLLKDIWMKDPNDMRNSGYNIIRDIVADNPASAYFGQKIVESGANTNYPDPLKRYWNVIIAKAAPINNFPVETIDDPVTGKVNIAAENTFRDDYYMRLAETYLLRAEAYLGKGDKINAAKDINVVRARAKAIPVEASTVNIEYILDERARELNFEELRTFTLMRMGKLVERVSTYHPMYNGKYTSHIIKNFQNLWPIPQSEIERNTEAVLEQNPGYK